ncbi:MAG: DUF4124 domain-containing protein [Gammaproteobacteria bacterium]
MRISHRLVINLAVLLALFALAFPFAVSALEVYKWTDEDGVVHYSESRPRAEAADIGSLETFEIDNAPRPGDASAGDYRTLLDVAERLEQSRLARERARAEQATQRAQQAATTTDTTQYTDDNVGYPVMYPRTGGYYRYPYYPHMPHFPYTPRLFPHYDHSTWPLNRGTFVPDIKQRLVPYNPAARARAEGGEAIRTH